MSDKLVLEVGKYYRDKAGNTFVVVSTTEEAPYRIIAICILAKDDSTIEGETNSFTSNGGFYSDGPHEYDLIEEVNFTGDKNETKQVTLEEITEKVKQEKEFKIKVTPETSGKVQKAIFAGGGRWFGGGTAVEHTDKQVLVVDGAGKYYSLAYCNAEYSVSSRVQELELIENLYFQTQQEVYKFLCEKEGNKVITADGGFKLYFKDGVVVSENLLGEVNLSTLYVGTSYKPYIETNWYDNIPEQGILCWIWNNNKKDKVPYLVTKYYKNGTYHFEGYDETCWKNAEPLTEEEVKQYIYKGSRTGFHIGDRIIITGSDGVYFNVGDVATITSEDASGDFWADFSNRGIWCIGDNDNDAGRNFYKFEHYKEPSL